MPSQQPAPKILGVIPARGGSKGIPRKNVKLFLGKPLLAWTVEAAKASGVLDRIIVSTEDREIAEIGTKCGAEVPFLRPAELAQDETPTVAVIQQLLEQLKTTENYVPEFVMVLEPTSPGRRAFHVREAAALLTSNGADSVASISPVPHHYVPPKVLTLQPDGWITGASGTAVKAMLHRRQELPAYYALNGLIFSCRSGLLFQDPPSLWGDKVAGYTVDPKYGLDLDGPEDWSAAEFQLQQIVNEEKR